MSGADGRRVGWADGRRGRRLHRLGLAAALLAVLATVACENLLTRPIIYGTVRVQALSRSGAPLPGIGVELFTSFRPMGYATTDAQGRATFPRVPRAQYGIAMHLPADYADLSELSPVPPGTIVAGINVDTGTDTTIHFTFARRGNGALEAEVVDIADGTPLGGITVTFYSANGIVGSRFTDAAGVARMEPLPFGQYGAFVLPPDTLGVPGLAGVFVDGLVVDRDVVQRAHFAIARCQGTISVQVADQDLMAVADHPVLLYTGAGVKRTVNTGLDGRVTFHSVFCGQYGVMAGPREGYDWVGGIGYVDGLNLVEDDSLDVTLRVRRLP